MKAIRDIDSSVFILSFIDIVLLFFLIFDFGYQSVERFKDYKMIMLPTLLGALVAFNFYKFKASSSPESVRRMSKINLVLLGICIGLGLFFIVKNYEQSFMLSFYRERDIIEYTLIFYFFVRLTFLLRSIYSVFYNPAILFIGSFGIIALAGACLLMLPSATTNEISFVDAFFTATSATSVTGLIVLDTAKDFTPFGQTVIMFLFQIGGLGMLTFTSFFAYFFKSGSSYKESLYMQDIIGYSKLNGVMSMVMQIVVFSLLLEAIGALLIYQNLEKDTFEHQGFFAIFHAISAYCNAGFSLASEGLYDVNLRFDYFIQWVLMVLIVFGGLGYHIAQNVVQYTRLLFYNLINVKKKQFISRVIKLNTRMILFTTAILIFVGTAFFYISEQNTHLQAHTTIFGKLTTSLFNSITARTAGFNTIDFANFSTPGILFMIFLMWVGASPASTGGGIKTTTFAIATLNIFATARDKKYIDIGTRRIAPQAVQRAFAIIAISLISVGFGILLILIFNPEFTLIQIAFEVFSAFSTVGVSLGITGDLSTASKYVVIFLMFFGRIGLLNLLIGLVKNVQETSYEYPEENIMIN